ncbi:MAG: hypothetical protein ACT4TC_13935 [Myxococcaceae bacterium]
MRRLGLLLILCFFASTEARAQFANYSISLHSGYLVLGDPSVSGAVPIGLGFSKYLDSGFEFTAHASFMILPLRTTGTLTWGLEVGPGIRYLFMEEEFRPYLGLDMSGRYIDGITTSNLFFGVGPSGGFEYFVSDQISIGLRGQLSFYLRLNDPVQLGGGALATFAAYF